jgi:predicted transcriptional regulator
MGGYFDGIYAADLPHRAVAVYMYLRNRAGRDGSCFPAVGTIAKDLSLSKRTVYRALEELEEKGFVKRSARWRERGGRSFSLYELRPP